MADNRQFQITFQIQALDRATAIIRGVRNILVGVGQAAKQVNADSANVGNQLANNLRLASVQAEKLQKKLADVGSALGQAGLGLAGAGAAVLAPLVLSVKSAGDFEAQMNKVKAVAEATPEEFKKMSDFAREMGKTAYASATQAAAGMLDLSRAGYKTEEVLSTLPTVLKLAAIEGLNAGQVSENLVRIMSAFGLTAGDAARVGDVLARTANDTVTSMGGLTEALKFAAPVARAVGMSIEETAGYLGTLAQNGLDATMAGTGLRRIMAVLMDPTTEVKDALYGLNVEVSKNADGSLNLYETLRRLKEANMSAADAFKIFGVWGSTAALGLTQQFDFLTKMIGRNKEAVGDLDAMAKTSLAGFNAAVGRLANSFNELMTAMGTPFLNVLTGAANAISGFVNWISDLAKSVPGLTFVLGSMAGVLGVLLAVFGALALAAGGLLLGVSALSKAWGYLTYLKLSNIKAAWQAILAHRAETAAIIAKTQAVTALTAALSAAARAQAIHSGVGGVLPTPSGPVPKAGRLGGMGIPALGGLAAGLMVGTPGTVGGNLEAMGIGGLSGLMMGGGLPGAVIGAGVASWYKVLTKDLWDLLDIWGIWERKREKSATTAPENAKPIETAQEKAEPRKTIQEQLDEVKNFYELEAKLLDVNTKKKQTNLKVEEEAYKSQVASDIASAWLRAQAMEAAELSFAAKRIQIEQNNHAQSMALKEEEYLKTKALLEEEAKDKASEKGKEAIKKLGELETKYNEARLVAEQKLTEEISKEIEKQYQKRAEHAKKIHELEQQMKDAQVEGARALAEITGKSVSESGRVESKFAEMRDTLRMAAEALPTMPEKAIQLAQQARSMAAGLVGDINAMKQSYTDFARGAQEGLLGIQKRGMSPIQGWYADIKAYEDTLAQARQATAAGNLEEAQKLASQAAQKAQGLANAPEGVSQQQAVQMAAGAFRDAVSLEGAVRREIIRREEERQQKAEAAVKEANTKLQQAYDQMVGALQKQITALDANTAALLGKKAEAEGKEGEVRAAASTQSPEAVTETPEPIPSLEGLGLGERGIQGGIPTTETMPGGLFDKIRLDLPDMGELASRFKDRLDGMTERLRAEADRIQNTNIIERSRPQQTKSEDVTESVSGASETLGKNIREGLSEGGDAFLTKLKRILDEAEVVLSRTTSGSSSTAVDYA